MFYEELEFLFVPIDMPVNDSTCFISFSRAFLFLIKYAAPAPSAVRAHFPFTYIPPHSQ